MAGVKDGLLAVMQVYKDTPAYVNGVQAGDRILKIDDHDVRGIGLETAGKLMRGPVGAQIELSVLREGRHEPVQFEITREEIIIPTVESKMLSDSRIGYIMISKFTEKTPNEMMQTLAGLLEQDIRGIILDLRDNPGGELVAATQVVDNFVPKGPIVYIDYRSGDEDVKNADDSYLQLPLAVLVNEYSASAAEILAGAIQDTETGVLVGTTTFGKGIVQTLFPLDNGAGLKLTTARYVTPDRNDIHNKGIQPDVMVENRDDLPGDEQLLLYGSITLISGFNSTLLADPRKAQPVYSVLFLLYLDNALALFNFLLFKLQIKACLVSLCSSFNSSNHLISLDILFFLGILIVILHHTLKISKCLPAHVKYCKP